MEFSQIIDLTYPVEEGMLTFEASWHPKVSIQQLGRIGLEGRESRRLDIGTHTGTHIDAALHFFKGGATIDETPLETLMGPVSIVDVSFLKENEALTSAMLEKVQVTRRMIFRFGWGRHWGTRRFYYGYPFMAPDAAKMLVHKGVKYLGFDIPSPDDSRVELGKQTLGTDADSPIHKIFLGGGVALNEYLANLDQIDELEGWHVAAIPLKITGADGSPARTFIFK